MRFTYYTKDNQQGCTRLSNCLSLRCLGPWMNHLPSVWWHAFRFRFFIVSWCEKLIWWRVIFLLITCPFSCFIHYPVISIWLLVFNLLDTQIFVWYFVLIISICVVFIISNHIHMNLIRSCDWWLWKLTEMNLVICVSGSVFSWIKNCLVADSMADSTFLKWNTEILNQLFEPMRDCC